MQEALPPPRSLTIMLQREVAERMAAEPPEMSILSVAVQFYGAPRILFRVGGGAFIPAPNVESAVVHIATHTPPLPPDERKAFFRVVTAGFAQRRKQLVNSLSTGLLLERDVIVSALTAAGIQSTQRPERLSVAEWVAAYVALKQDLR
jgi:16S rRNA (adenine1518-N6/adenine1519-N6)-dimethyltransferase